MKQRKTKRRQKLGSNFKKPKRVSQKQYGGGRKEIQQRKKEIQLEKELKLKFIDACRDGNLKEAITIYENNKSKIDSDDTIDSAFGNVCFNIRELGEEGIINIGNWLLQIKPNININNGPFESAVNGIFESNSINLVKWFHSMKPNALNEIPYETVFFIFLRISGKCNIEIGKFFIEIYPNILNDKTCLYRSFDYASINENENCIEYMEWLITIEPTILNNTSLIDSIFWEVCHPESYRKKYHQTLNKIALWIVNKNPLRYWVEIDMVDNVMQIVDSGIRNVTDADKLMYSLSETGVLDLLDANTVSDIVGEVKANEKK